MLAPAPVSSRPVRLLLARWISIFGHPLLLMPAAGALAWFTNGGSRRQVLIAGFAWWLLATVVLGYAWWRVRHADWSHIDASTPVERRDLNRFLIAVLFASAAVGAMLQWPAPAPVLLGLLLSAVIVLAAVLCGRWCKPSLHLAFATFAAAVMHVVSPWTLLGGLLLGDVDRLVTPAPATPRRGRPVVRRGHWRRGGTAVLAGTGATRRVLVEVRSRAAMTSTRDIASTRRRAR